MGETVSIKIEGMPELDRALEQLVERTHSEAPTAMADGGEILAAEWRSRVPVGHAPEDPHPDAYRSGITVQHEETRAGGSALVNIHGEAVHYAHRLEYGYAGVDSAGRRVHTPPQPSARPAFDAAQAKIEAAAAAKMKAAAEKR